MSGRVLITGGFGFIGGRLSQYLSQSGYQIVLGTRGRCESPDWLPRAEIVQVHWDNSLALERVCSGVDVVIQAAGMNAQDCANDFVGALEFNGLATARLVKAAASRGVKRFIYLSTAHIYANPLVDSITEETCPRNLHPYATSHRSGEDVVLGSNQQEGMRGVVLRLSNAFGAPAHIGANCWMLLANDLCRQAVTDRHMVLRSSGTQRRDFVPMLGVCQAINHLLQIPEQDIGKGLFNVGGEWSPTVWDMADLIQKRCELILGFRPQLNRMAPDVGESVGELDYRLDAIRRTGFQPALDGMTEIDRLIKFCSLAFSPQ